MNVDLDQYKGKRVAVLGGTGMLGRAVCRRLDSLGAEATPISRATGHDLRDQSVAVRVLSLGFDYCFGVAGFNGGIGLNSTLPSTIFENNAQIALNAVEACALTGVPYLGVLASCGYPESEDGVLREETYLDGRPHPSVACHGLAKRVMLEACRFAAVQYPAGKFRCVCIPTAWGPDDHFEPERTKVVGAMIARMVDAADQKLDTVTCWGSGSPLRDLLYADDAACLILAAGLANWCGKHPLNLSVGDEYSVREIAEAAARATGYAGTISWDETKPDGQHRKKLQSRRAGRVLGSFLGTPFERAMDLTVEGYRKRFRSAVKTGAEQSEVP